MNMNDAFFILTAIIVSIYGGVVLSATKSDTFLNGAVKIIIAFITVIVILLALETVRRYLQCVWW